MGTKIVEGIRWHIENLKIKKSVVNRLLVDEESSAR